MIYLVLSELLHVADRALAGEVAVRDVGLLESTLARPQATAFGDDAYPTLALKAAALLHSLARNHALVDGNKRLALAATIAFVGINGFRLTYSNDEAYELIWPWRRETSTMSPTSARASSLTSSPGDRREGSLPTAAPCAGSMSSGASRHAGPQNSAGSVIARAEALSAGRASRKQTRARPRHPAAPRR